MAAPSDTHSTVRRTILPNGTTIVTEAMPHVRTAAFAVTTRQGSRDEADTDGGLSHFLEHFVFRGTLPSDAAPSGRTPRDIAVETDLLGGDFDAWTDREATSYSVEVAADLLPRAAHLVMDLVARPALEARELERERSVIREEIRGLEEDSEELAYDLSAQLAWPGHPLGRPVQGSVASVDTFTREQLAAFSASKHVGGNLLVCAAGSLDHDEVVELTRAGLGALGATAPPNGPAAPPPAAGRRIEERKHLDQAQVVLALPGLATGDPGMPALGVLATALGSGVSSRLWLRIREEEGLAYDVSLGHESHRDQGRLLFHATCSPENLPRVLAIFDEELAAIRASGLGADELDRVKTGLRSGMVLGQESPGQRLSELAWGELVHGRTIQLDERLARLAAVTSAQVDALAERLLVAAPRGLVVIGPDAKILGGKRASG